jgi:hypothetical protein
VLCHAILSAASGRGWRLSSRIDGEQCDAFVFVPDHVDMSGSIAPGEIALQEVSICRCAHGVSCTSPQSVFAAHLPANASASAKAAVSVRVGVGDFDSGCALSCTATMRCRCNRQRCT